MITKDEETAYRLCSHEHRGLTTKEAAKQMKISQRRVQQLLQSINAKAPQLFPILTRQQAEVEELLNGQGCTHEQVASRLHITTSTVASVVKALRAKGVYFETGRETLSFDSKMDDGRIKEKF